MPSTAHGWPYVSGPMHPHDYPVVSKALADKLEALDFVDTTPFAPGWSQTGGSALAIGNGSLEGRWSRAAGIILANVSMVRGSTTNKGGENYIFTLTGLPAASYKYINGTGFFVHAGAVTAVTVFPIIGVNVRLVRSSDGKVVNHDIVAWAPGDVINFNVTALA